MTIERIVTTAIVIVASAILVLVLRLERRRLIAAVSAAAIVAALDVVTELVFGRLGVWEYRLPGAVLGIPIELPIDLFCLLLCVSAGHAAVSRRSDRHPRWLYLAIVTVGLGTWAFIKNTRVAKLGIVVFAPQIGVDSPWFAVGNYLAAVVLIGGVTLLQRAFSETDSR